MSCIYNKKPSDRHCEYCSAVCDERLPKKSRIAAHKLGFDFTGCEIDKEYFDKSCERFDRECNGIYTLKDGTKVQQQKLFDSI